MKQRPYNSPVMMILCLAVAMLIGTSPEIAAQLPPDVVITQGTSVIPDGGSFDFGDTDVGSFNTVTFTLHNYSFAPVQPTSVPRVVIDAAGVVEFLLLDDLPAFIPPGSLATFTISFSPASGGLKSATVAIPYLNPSENSYDFVVRGTGVLVTVDSDGDGIPDDVDNCPDTHNPDQADLDGDGIGDACDPDADGDGFAPADGDCDDMDSTIHPGADEICGDGIDQDCDGYDLACVVDSDGDGIPDDGDNCPYTPNADQADLDGDGIGDVCDWDVDGDGYEPAAGDCDDTDASVNPGATEIYGDGIDQDCDGSDQPCDDPYEAIQNLIWEVSLLDGASQRLRYSLTAKLKATLRSLEKGRENAAANRLGAFVSEVEAHSGGKIPAEQADALILQAEMVRDCILIN